MYYTIFLYSEKFTNSSDPVDFGKELWSYTYIALNETKIKLIISTVSEQALIVPLCYRLAPHYIN